MKEVIVDLGCGTRKRTKGGKLLGSISKNNCADVLRAELGRFPKEAEVEESWRQYNAPKVIGIDKVKTNQVDIVCTLGYEPIPLEDGSADYVLAHDLIEHIPFVDGERRPIAYLFDEVFRILKLGGYFEILTPVFPHYDLLKFFNPKHKSYWGPETIRKFCCKFILCTKYISRNGKEAILLLKYIDEGRCPQIAKKASVAILARSLTKYITGGTRRRIEIANRLARRGWDVTMYTFDAEPTSPRWQPLTLEVPLEKRVDGIEADFVICGDIFEDPLETEKGTFLSAKAKIKKIWLMQLYRPNTQGPILEDREIVKVANSNHMASVLRDKYGQKAHLAIGGVDTEFFHPQPETEGFIVATYREKWRIEGAERIHAFQEIDGSKNQLELRQRYWNCKVFVSLEHADFYGWCNPVAEAMACGRACVAVDSPHVRDLIIDGVTGLLAKPDANDIKEKLLRLRDTNFRKPLIEAGVKHIRQFDWERVVDSLEACMLALVKEPLKV